MNPRGYNSKPATASSKYGTAGRDDKTVHFADRDGRGGRGGRGDNSPLTDSLAHITCDCDEPDADSIYGTCFQIADWIEDRLSTLEEGIEERLYLGGGHTQRKRKRHMMPISSVGVAGTSLTSPIYGDVVFNITFFNEVTKTIETLTDLQAKVIDNCIDIIVDRLKIPHYFYETNRSEPNRSQSVEPVALLSTSARCVGAQPRVT